MADMQQLESAFMKAHKAGDTKAAGVIAAEIKRQRAASAAPPDQVSGLMDQFKAGLESNTEMPGQTIEAFGQTAGSDSLRDAGTWLRGITDAPKGFVSATDRFINPKPGDSYVDPIMGFGWGNAPGAAAEVGGQMVGDVAVRSAGGAVGGAVGGAATGGPGAVPGAAVGAFAAPAMLEFMRTAGPVALQRAKNDGREVPNWEDWQVAAGTAGLSGFLNGIGIKGIGALNEGVKEVGKKTITQVGKEAVTETAKKAGKEGLTETGQSIVQQYGEGVGTKAGVNIDLKQAVGEGILGAGGGAAIDVGRNIRPTVRVMNDIRVTDSQMRNNPDAQMQAEVTRDVNSIADRMKGSKKDPLSQEINRNSSDLKRQINEAIDGQNLAPEDKKALKGGMTDATGLTPDRLDEIAGRSENPDQIKALARKIQVIREMTMQKQTAKGLRGWAAMGASTLGGAAGAAIGGTLGGVYGGAAGAQIGQNIGRDIARRLRGNQTQGNAIDSLVGVKQARRAKLLLDRYGPSEATTALNTLTEKAAANKAQAEADAQAKKDFDETMSRIRYQNSLREKSRKAVEQATSKEEKAKAQAEKQKVDLATREERLKAMAFRAQINQARAQKLVQDMEAKKTLNALHVEMQQTKAELQQKTAEAKADKMNRDAKFQADNLQGKLEMLAIDIKRRNEALKKAEIATKRAEKMSTMAPASAKPTLARIRNMNSKWAQSVQEDGGIDNKPAYQSAVQYLDTLRQEAQHTIKAEPSEPVRNLLRETLTDLLSLKNNWDARRERFARAMQDAKSIGGDAPQKLRDTLYQLAHYKAPEGPSNGSAGGDYSPPPPRQEAPIPPAPQKAAPPPPSMMETPLPPRAEPMPRRTAPVPPPRQEAPTPPTPPVRPVSTGQTLGEILVKPKNSHHMFLGDFGFSFEANNKGRYLWLTAKKGQKVFQSSDGGPADSDTTHVWSFKDPNQGNSRTGPKVGVDALPDNVPPELVSIFRGWLDGKIDETEAVNRIKRTKRGGSSGEQDPPF